MIAEGNSGKVIVFSEKTKGWVSFRSFTQMQLAISMANDFYTFHEGNLWKHYDERVDRNTFYGIGPDQDTNAESSITVVLNDNPGLIKAFNTLNYEGSQSNIPQFTSVTSSQLNLDDFQPLTTYNDQEIYNLSSKDGWYVENIFTDKEEGYINEFIEKEGKWFNNINRLIDIELSQADTDDFTFQGIGRVSDVDDTDAVVNTGGCMDNTMFNFDPNATIDDGSCIPIILGCMEPTAINYNEDANTDDESCIATVGGCTDTTAFNYDPLANTDDGSCVPYIYGCTDETANNYDALANTDNGTCTFYGCTNVNALNYNPNAIIDDGSCVFSDIGGGAVALIYGCTIATAVNYNPSATVNDGSCMFDIGGGGGVSGYNIQT